MLLQDVDHWNARDPWHGLPFRGDHDGGTTMVICCLAGTGADGQELKHQTNIRQIDSHQLHKLNSDECSWSQFSDSSESFFPMTVLFNQPWICWTYSENEIADGSNSHDHGSEAKLRKPPVKLMVLGLIFSALMLLSIVTAVFYGIGKWLGAFWSTLESPTRFFETRTTVGQIVPQKFWNTKWLQ